MRMKQLRYFITVAETGSIASAAKKLYVSAPAVSIAIANLERELEVSLFIRERNRLMLTPLGQSYYLRVLRIFQDIDEATEEIRKMAGV